MTTRSKTAAKERKPGISRTVCRIPMSVPSKWMASMAKLVWSAFHVAKER
jgi:hypothetical protein